MTTQDPAVVRRQVMKHRYLSPVQRLALLWLLDQPRTEEGGDVLSRASLSEMEAELGFHAGEVAEALTELPAGPDSLPFGVHLGVTVTWGQP